MENRSRIILATLATIILACAIAYDGLGGWWFALAGLISGAMYYFALTNQLSPETSGAIIALWLKTKEWFKNQPWKKLVKRVGAILGAVAGVIIASGVLWWLYGLVAGNPLMSVAVFGLIVLYAVASLERIPYKNIRRVFLFFDYPLFWMDAGLKFVPFLICKLGGTIDCSKQNTDGRFTAATKEEKGKLELDFKFSVFWLADIDNLFTFFKIKTAFIHDELQDAVQEVILGVVGQHSADDILEKVEYVQLLIQCYLSLPREKVPCGHSFKEAFDYCVLHTDEVRKLLADNKNKSEIEERLGITIEMFSLSDTDLTEAVKASMEAARKAEEEQKAIEIKAQAEKERVKILEEGKKALRDELFKRTDISTAEVVEATEIAYGQATRTINSFRGLSGTGNAPIVVVNK